MTRQFPEIFCVIFFLRNITPFHEKIPQSRALLGTAILRRGCAPPANAQRAGRVNGNTQRACLRGYRPLHCGPARLLWWACTATTTRPCQIPLLRGCSHTGAHAKPRIQTRWRGSLCYASLRFATRRDRMVGEYRPYHTHTFLAPQGARGNSKEAAPENSRAVHRFQWRVFKSTTPMTR